VQHNGPSILITYPFPIGQKDAGGSRTIGEIAHHLTLGGAKVTIMPVSTNAHSRSFPRAAVSEKVLGLERDDALARQSIDIVRVPQNPWLFQLDGLSVKKAVRRLLRERSFDLVLGHYNEAGFLPALCRQHGIEFGYLATWQTYAYLGRPAARVAGRLQKWLDYHTVIKPHRAADVQFAISDFTRRELIQIVGVDDARIVICPLGVEPTFLDIPRAKPETITRLVYFGRITPSKGFVDAIEALGKVAARGNRDWTYRMIGAGRVDWATEAAAKNGITDLVEIREPVDTAGLRRELERAHLAVLPSHIESFGHSIVEAQAAGIPVVAYAAGSVPEVLEDGVTGWLAPFRDTDRLSELIERAILDPELTYETGLRGRERVRKSYDWSLTAGIILDWLETRRSTTGATAG